MAPTSLLNIVSLALLALFAATLSTPAAALSLQSEHVVRSHHDIARHQSKRATNARRCKPRSSSAAAPSSTKKAVSTSAAKKATTTAKPPAATTKAAVKPVSGAALRGKAGIGWPNGNEYPLAPWAGSQAGFLYTWSESKPSGADSLGFQFAPMLWGYKNAAAFKAAAVEGYAKYALGMNEPNQPGQSTMSAGEGVSMWKQYMLPLAGKGYTLISPAVSSAASGKTWMSDFFNECNGGCAVGGIAVHYYGTDIDEFKTYVTYWYDTYKLPLYITEFADQDFGGGAQASASEVKTFMEAAKAFINGNSWIHAACWFGAMTNMGNVNYANTLMASSGQAPNDLGYYWINN